MSDVSQRTEVSRPVQPPAVGEAYPYTLPVSLRNYELLAVRDVLPPSTFFEARNAVLGHELMVRRVTIDPARAENVRDTFYREMRHVAALQHPHIMKPLDVFEAEGFLWSVHEQWNGVASTTMIRENGPLDAATAARLGAQVADALALVHSHGFVHGKVHPYGIGISDRGDAQLYNFVKSADLAAGIWPLRPVVLGLSPFSAPEEREGRIPTAASDLYSLAATICYWMCGIEPREDETTEAWMLRGAEEHRARGTGATCKQVPRGVLDAIQWALEPDPASVADRSTPSAPCSSRRTSAWPRRRRPGSARARRCCPRVPRSRSRSSRGAASVRSAWCSRPGARSGATAWP